MARQSESMSSGSVRSFVSKIKMVRKRGRHVISFSGLSTQVHTPREHIHVPHANMRREGVIEKGRRGRKGREKAYKWHGCIGKC